VIIIDSFSHEYDGIGGIMEWAANLEEKGLKAGGQWKEPKLAHRKLMNELLQIRAYLIFCLRADEKIRIARENGKTVVEPLGWMPICEKRFMFEMTASFTLTPDKPGIPHFDLPHKLQRQHRAFFTDTAPISEESGQMLAEWALGGNPEPTRQHRLNNIDDVMAWNSKLATASHAGIEVLRETWGQVPHHLKPMLKPAMEATHKPTAEKAPA
jgi:hypothetical protein